MPAPARITVLALLDGVQASPSTGEKFFHPEALFDMDYPGHYLRHIKSVGLTIPCVVGPYTSLNCTLTLASNKIRVNNDTTTEYRDNGHFVINFAASESIATSSGQNDSGLFILNFNDER